MQNVDAGYPKVSLFIVTDGRLEYLQRTLSSLTDNLVYGFCQKFIVNDSMDKTFRAKLNQIGGFYGFDIIHHRRKQGFAGAYHTAFNTVNKESDYSFIMEDDFTFNEPVNLNEMISIIQDNPYLCQIALKRQAWGESEIKAGGLVEMWPDLYTNMNGFCQHRNFFTTNPSLVPAWVIKQGWPLVPKSEKAFSDSLFYDPIVHSAYLGHKFDAPKVNHIGEVRKGKNY